VARRRAGWSRRRRRLRTGQRVSGDPRQGRGDAQRPADRHRLEPPSGESVECGDAAEFDNAKIGYDNNGDRDIADAGDDIAWDQSFGATTDTVSHDHAGNLIDDGDFRYVYDAWNRLVQVRASEDSGAATVQTAEFDALGRRIKKVVTNSGDFDGTVVYLYDAQKIIETRPGSGNLYQQFIHGTQYIDELVMVRVKDKGDLYVHQAERDREGSVKDWNVIGLTDLGGSLVERHVYRPYGEVTVNQETGYGDRDGDGDVDATDKGTPGTDSTGTVTGACRILDLDFDGDYDSADATLFDSLPQGLARHPGRLATSVHQPCAHQGLLHDPEIASYQNRLWHYDAAKRRFLQRDPGALTTAPFSSELHVMNRYPYGGANPIASTPFTEMITLAFAGRVSDDPAGEPPSTWFYDFKEGDVITGSFTYTLPATLRHPGLWTWNWPAAWIEASVNGAPLIVRSPTTWRFSTRIDGSWPYDLGGMGAHIPIPWWPCALIQEFAVSSAFGGTLEDPPVVNCPGAGYYECGIIFIDGWNRCNGREGGFVATLESLKLSSRLVLSQQRFRPEAF
jgi:RHS repeat-associated protein